MIRFEYLLLKRQVIEMKINRIHKIQELLEDVHSVSINTLCETFQVSKNTIRRDIAESDIDHANGTQEDRHADTTDRPG